ncbi:hypothetical protein EG329_000373 [Mollisiaceae sp. DMI_Dod_QoI]|nr:hypothetical protein EG329_000373 [Helotiales sp. DMI_Dod_QoI]
MAKPMSVTHQSQTPPLRDSFNTDMSMSDDELMGRSTSIRRTQESRLINNNGLNLSDMKADTLQEPQEPSLDALESLIEIDQEYLQSLKPETRAKHEKDLADGPPYSRIIEVALTPAAPHRCVTLPECFDIRGKLKHPWGKVLETALRQARAAKKQLELAQKTEKPVSNDDSRASRGKTSKPGKQASKKISKAAVNTKGINPETFLSETTNGYISEELPQPRHTRSAGPDPLSPSPVTLNALKDEIVLSSSASEPPQSNHHARPRTTLVLSQHKSPSLIPESQSSSFGQGYRTEKPPTSTPKSTQDGQASIAANIIQTLPIYGQDWLDHQDEICRPLAELSGVLSQYIAMAYRAPPPHIQIPFPEMPCICYESEPSDDPLIPVVRQLLGIREGISITKHIEMICPETENAVWIKGILMFLINQYLFESGSPFEDASTLRKGLSPTGLSSNLIDMIVQDTRIRTMKEKPENVREFSERRRLRYHSFIKQLNGTMHSLIGGNSETHDLHVSIAGIVSDLNMRMFAYRGTYAPINPKIGELFDTRLHALDNPELEGPGLNHRDLEEKPILMTMIVGVKFKPPGGDWIVCAPAKVRLLRPVEPAKQRTPLPKASVPSKKRKNHEVSCDN